ncbi:uncharacterized protein LOC144093892 [Amblyomma americanum]
MDDNHPFAILTGNGTRNISRLPTYDSPFILQNNSLQNVVTEAQQLIKGRHHEDFGAAGPVVVMLGCLFLMFFAVGIPTFIQKKRREARERREAIRRLAAAERQEAAAGLAFQVPAMDS